MKLSFSIMLLVAAAAQINAAVTPNAAASCIAGSSGLGKGDGYKGYCCKTEADCLDDCVKGVCVGPAPPTKTSSTATPTPTPGTCTPGSSGLGKGDGYKGYCCKTQADCVDDCVKGVCVGPAPPSKTTTEVSKTTTNTPTGTPSTCTPGSSGLGKGDGYKGYCCKTQADCIDDCVKGVCVGPVNTKTTTPVTKTTTPVTTTTSTPGTCTPGSSGKNNGDGGLNACCKTSDDCQNACINGKCNAP